MKTEKQIIRDTMYQDILQQGERIADLLPSIRQQLQGAIAALPLQNIHQVYMTGCGDSYYAGCVIRQAFYQYAGIPANEIEAYELMAYEGEYLQPDALLIAVSISGQVGTTLDTISLAKQKGIATLGLNANPGSRIWQVADAVIDVGVRLAQLGPVPQTYHFLGNVAALYLTAVELGLQKGHITSNQADQAVQQLQQLLATQRSNALLISDQVKACAQQFLQAKQRWTIVGGGCNAYTAAFGIAKLHEAACTGGIWQESEEWAHVQYFGTDDSVFTTVLAPRDSGYAGSKKVISSCLQMGWPCAVVTDLKNPDTFEGAAVFKIDLPQNPVLLPLALKQPLELFAYWLSEIQDIRPFQYDNPRRKAVVERAIYADGVSGEAAAKQQNK